jgi:TldD protein
VPASSFRSLPLDGIADAAIQTARDAGATHVEIRVETTTQQVLQTRDRAPLSSQTSENAGIGVRVIAGGGWGFASISTQTPGAAAAAARRAVALAHALAPLNAEPVELADEPVHVGEHTSSYTIDPFEVSDADKFAYLLDLADRVLQRDAVERVDGHVILARETSTSRRPPGRGRRSDASVSTAT